MFYLKNIFSKIGLRGLIFFAASVVGACGGGGSSAPASVTPPPAPSCSRTEILSNGQCICPANHIRQQDGSCGCRAGYRVDSGNMCVEVVCPPTEIVRGSVCVCAAGRERQSTGDCACKIDHRASGNICERINCPAGKIIMGGNCVCAPGTRLVGNLCKPITCAFGETLANNTCVCAAGRERKQDNSCGCLMNYRSEGNICIPFTCPAGKVAAGENCVCASGTRPMGATCVAFTCPAEKIPQGAVCVCRPGYELAAGGACIPENYDTLPNIDQEHLWHYGLDSINVRGAYHQGFFGQGVTIGIADSGVITTHADFGDRIVPGYNAVAGSVTSEISDSSGHGTFVALVAAAGIGGDPRGLIFGLPQWAERSGVETTITLPAVSGYFHGVAPAAAVMPLQFGDHKTTLSGDPWKLFDHAVSSKIQIVNNSWGRSASYYWRYAGHGGTVYKISLPLFSFIRSSSIEIKGRGADIRRRTGNADMVYVWASGNDGWHYSPGGSESPGSDRLRMCAYDSLAAAKNDGACGSSRSKKALAVRSFTQQQVLDNTRHIPGGSSLLVSLIPSARTLSYRNDPGGYSNIPLDEPTLLKKWLVVGAINAENKLAYFSNGCGPAKMWCLVAPGRSLRLAPRCRRALCRARSGTSFAAPHVSGALAVIKSAAPALPMEVIRAALLTTATDLGAKGIDNVFGWGLPDVEAAVSLVRSATVADTGLSAPDQPQVIHIPAHWGALGPQLTNLSLAVGWGDGAYYNVPLSLWVGSATTSPQAVRPAAAKEMLAATGQSLQINDDIYAVRANRTGRIIAAGGLWGGWRLERRFCALTSCPDSVWDNLLPRGELAQTVAPPFFTNEARGRWSLQKTGTGLRPFATGSRDFPGYRQLGIQWRAGADFGYQLEYSHVTEGKTFWGANLGPAGEIKNHTRLGKFSFGGVVAPNWRVYSAYEHAVGASATGRGLLKKVDKLRNSQWETGISRANLFTTGDEFRLQIHQAGPIRGQLQLTAGPAQGDFTCQFYKPHLTPTLHKQLCRRAAPNRISAAPVINLVGPRRTRWNVGYSRPLAGNAQARWAATAEYTIPENLALFSAAVQIDF